MKWHTIVCKHPPKTLVSLVEIEEWHTQASYNKIALLRLKQHPTKIREWNGSYHENQSETVHICKLENAKSLDYILQKLFITRISTVYETSIILSTAV